MSFLDGRSGCVYLWLFAVILGVGCAEEVPRGTEAGIIRVQRLHSDDQPSPCMVPPQPWDGRWKLHRLYCDDDLDCDIPQGVELRNGTRLVYKCNSGYRLEGNNDVHCTARGKWSAIPSCVPSSRTCAAPAHCLLWSQPSVSRRDDYTYIPGIGSYKIYTRAASWTNARLICEEEGGHLAIINSVAESKAIAELIAHSEPVVGSPHPTFFCVGFHDLFNEGTYVTIFGQSLAKAGFTQWADGQPDNYGGTENCGSVFKDGRLNDIDCNETKFGFICEMPSH